MTIVLVPVGSQRNEVCSPAMSTRLIFRCLVYFLLANLFGSLSSLTVMRFLSVCPLQVTFLARLAIPFKARSPSIFCVTEEESFARAHNRVIFVGFSEDFGCALAKKMRRAFVATSGI